MCKWFQVLISMLVLLVGLSACSSERSDENVREQILATQAARFRAMVEVDIEVLERVLADDLVYTHTTGAAESKTEFIANLRARLIEYQAIEPSEIDLRVFPDLAVITGRADLRVRAGGQPLAAAIRFIEVYARRGGWQLIGWQSTRLPQNTDAATAIRAVHDRFVAAVIAGKPDNILATLSPQIIVMPANGHTIFGQAAAREWLESVSAEPLPDATYETDEVLISATLAIERGTYRGGIGKRIWIYQRQSDGGWKISHIIWNHNPVEPGSG